MPVTTSQITGSVSGIVLNNGSYANPLTVTDTGVVTGAQMGIYANSAAAWAIVNYGDISGAGTGVVLADGGSIANQAHATISGGYGIQAFGDLTTIDNSGAIAGTTTVGIYVGAGGTVTNETSGTITGSYAGIDFLSAPGTVVNDGSISGAGATTGAAGVVLADGGSVTNQSMGTIAGYNGILIAGDVGTVVNMGTISGLSLGPLYVTGVNLLAGGSVANETGAIISGRYYGVFINGGSGTIDNFGTIAATYARGAVLYDGGSLTNETGGTISGGFAGVYAAAMVDTIIDAGLIKATTGDGIFLNAGGSVSIATTGTIDAETGIKAIYVAPSIDNAGTISAFKYGGIYLRDGGSITNESTGRIAGANYGIYAYSKAGTVINAGTITGNGYHYVTAHKAPPLDAIALYAGGTVINTGTISGASAGIIIKGASTATVENAGMIDGGTGNAIYLDATATNRLIVDAGAKFTGNVVANATAANTLELTSGASGGTLSGLGATYQNFHAVTIDNGASWDIAGTKAGLDGSTIHGFHAGDRLDITDLGFTTGDTATYSGGILTLYDSGQSSLGTIDLTGALGDHIFNVLTDGNNGMFVEEDGVACYCRGTLILTTKGEVPVEDLKIGDKLITHWGAAKPIRWIGTRSYSGRFAAGNRNILPIRIAAGALADNVPARDLWVSPLHAMFLDDVLIPAMALVNGTSITQADAVETVEYFHLELETHDVIVAEGALAESFIDDDSRGMFHNAAEYRRLYPHAPRKPAEYCAPIVEDGPELEAVRGRIAARAEALKLAA